MLNPLHFLSHVNNRTSQGSILKTRNEPMQRSNGLLSPKPGSAPAKVGGGAASAALRQPRAGSASVGKATQQQRPAIAGQPRAKAALFF